MKKVKLDQTVFVREVILDDYEGEDADGGGDDEQGDLNQDVERNMKEAGVDEAV